MTKTETNTECKSRVLFIVIWALGVLGILAQAAFAQDKVSRVICAERYVELFDSFASKKIETLPLKVGLELEGSVPIQVGRSGVAHQILHVLEERYPNAGVVYYSNSDEYAVTYRKKNKEYREWIVKNETTIDTNRVPLEVNSSVLNDLEDLEDFKKVIREIRKLGVSAEPQSGGVHVHVDFGQSSVGEMATLMAVFSDIEEQLKRAFGSKNTRSPFVQPTSQEVMNYLKDAEIPTFENDFSRIFEFVIKQSRNHGLNMHSIFKFDTVEFRVFNSTFDLSVLSLMADFSMKLVKAVRTKDPALLDYFTKSQEPIQLDRLASILGMKLSQTKAREVLNRIFREAEKRKFSQLVVALGTAAVIQQWAASTESLFN